MLFKKINIAISKLLVFKKFETFGHIVLLLVIVFLTIEMTYNNGEKYNKYEYSVLCEWIAYFIAIISVIYLNLLVLVPRFLLKGRLTKYVCLIGLNVIISLAAIIAAQNLFFDVLPDSNSETVLLNIFGNILSIGLIILSTSIFSLLRGWQENSQRINELETATIETELKQLRNQINPHFLFNTINNANIKVEKDPEAAYSIITRLEDLLRYQLADTSNDRIRLKNDVSFLSDYLELEKTRRNRFFYTIETDERIGTLEIYPLLFIPFVENAVKHSLTTKGESNISIAFLKENDYLHFCCENSKPMAPVKQKTGGLGLKNIKRRLDLLYGDTYTLDVAESDEKYIVNLYLKI
jgi:sensor histidine kinase YesM